MLSVKWRRKKHILLIGIPSFEGPECKGTLENITSTKWPFSKRRGSLFSCVFDAMYRSRRKLPRDVRRPAFPHLGQRKRWKSDIMRLSSTSPFDGSAREELGRVEDKWKNRMRIRKRNNADSFDDMIKLASKWVEVMVTARPSSKPLCLPALRRVHWIWFIRQDGILSFCVL